MMAARVAGVPRPVSFMASESSFSSSVLPAVSIAVSSVASVKRLGGRVAFLHGVNFDHSLKLAFLKIWGQNLGGSLVLDSSVGFSRDLLGRALQHLPSGLFHR